MARVTYFIAAERGRAYTGGVMRPHTSRTSRRHLLRGSLGVCGLALLAGCGITPPWDRPSPRPARIGWLALDPPGGPAFVRNSGAFRQGLAELGWAEGRTMTFEVRSAGGRLERLPEAAAELVALPVDVLVPGAGAAGALVASRATSTVPIVMVAVGDPVGLGLVASLNRPGRNVTGLSNTTATGSGKRLELLREAVPGLARADFLWNPAASSGGDWAELQIAAGLPDGLIVHAPGALLSHARRLVALVAGLRLPAIYQFREYVEAGGLMAYGVSLPDLYRRAAGYVDKILKGANPAELPVELPAKFDFVINLGAAQGLGLTVPPSVLQQATELIE
jgi:putative tryptophan/tyrosine transport system substrate-binding protein